MATKKFRKKVSDFRREVDQLEEANSELDKLYVHAMKRADDAEKALAEANATMARLRGVIKDDSERLTAFSQGLDTARYESHAHELECIHQKTKGDLLREIIVEALITR